MNLIRLYLSLPIYFSNISNQENAIVLIADEKNIEDEVLDKASNVLKDKASEILIQQSPVVEIDPLGQPITEADIKIHA